MKTAQFWIDTLNLQPHPEGGYYRETYRSNEVIPKNALPQRFGGDRVFSTCIYFLLEQNDFSAFHRIKQDEFWHFYYGSGLIIHTIKPDGAYESAGLGTALENNEYPQIWVAAGNYFAVELADKNSYALTGCTVAPGFDFNDFEMPAEEQLVQCFPNHEALIRRLTK